MRSVWRDVRAWQRARLRARSYRGIAAAGMPEKPQGVRGIARNALVCATFRRDGIARGDQAA